MAQNEVRLRNGQHWSAQDFVDHYKKPTASGGAWGVERHPHTAKTIAAVGLFRSEVAASAASSAVECFSNRTAVVRAILRMNPVNRPI